MRRRDAVAAIPGGWFGLGLSGAAGAREQPTSLVAVAASVQPAMEEIAPGWMRASGHRLSIAYGSSGNFARQIQQGLPAELFLSADEGFALRLADGGLTRGRGVVYARGRLALVLAKGSAIALDPQLLGLKAAWPSIRKFATANPEVAPYGKAAREVLEAAGLWQPARGKLVMGENIAQAAQFVATGAADAGITALSLVIGTKAGGLGRHLALPEALHGPLRQRMVLLRQAGAAAEAFYDHLQSAPARAILIRHGFGADRP